MKSSFINKVHVEGYLFNFGNNERQKLQKRISRRTGQEFIQGELNIATDEDANNVVTVYYTYVTPTFKSGKENGIYTELADLLENGKTYEQVGTEATKVRMDGNFETNDFWSDRNEQFVAARRIRGGFIHQSFKVNPQATFELEVVCVGCNEREFNDDNYVQVNAFAFDYRNYLLPITLDVRSDGGKSYFLDQDISPKQPFVDKVWGNIISSTGTRIVEEESAFGEPQQREVQTSIHSWEIIGASPEPLEFGDESVITAKELKQLTQERLERLEANKKRQEEWQASQTSNGFNNAPKATETTAEEDSNEDDDEFDYPF